MIKVEKKSLRLSQSFAISVGDMLSAGGGCELAAETPCKCDKDMFCYMPLPFSPTAVCPFADRGVFSMCKECDAACSRDLGNDRGYTEQSVA